MQCLGSVWTSSAPLPPPPPSSSAAVGAGGGGNPVVGVAMDGEVPWIDPQKVCVGSESKPGLWR